MTISTIEPLVYSVDEAAQAIRVSPGMIRKLIATGALQASRVGDRVLVRREALKALLLAE